MITRVHPAIDFEPAGIDTATTGLTAHNQHRTQAEPLDVAPLDLNPSHIARRRLVTPDR